MLMMDKMMQVERGNFLNYTTLWKRQILILTKIYQYFSDRKSK